MPQMAFGGNPNSPCAECNDDLATDGNLNGAIFAENATGMYAYYENNQIYITSQYHKTAKIKIKKNALENRLKNFDLFNVGITHIDDNGMITHYTDAFEPYGDFVFATYNFSTIIISGFTGTTTYTATNISGNQTITFPFGNVNVSSVDFSITNHALTPYSVNGYDWDYNLSIYNYYETNRVPPADLLVGISDLAGVDVYWLITGESNAAPVGSANDPIIQRAAALLSGQPNAAEALAAFRAA